MLLLVYAFTGFEMGMIPSGEVRDPQRNLPFALLTGIGVVASVYIGIQVVCIGTLPSLASSERPLVDAAGRFLGAAGAALITAGAVISIIGNLGVSLLAGSRIPFAMAERRELPAFFAATHARFRTPHRAVLLTAALMLVLTLSGTFIYALTVSTLVRLVIYGATCAALPLLRRRAGPAPFRAPAGLAVSAASLALIVWLLGHATRLEARDTGHRRPRRPVDPRHVPAGPPAVRPDSGRLTNRCGSHTFAYMKDAVLTVRLPRRTRGRIEQAARREGRSLSQQVERLVEAGLAAGDEGRIRPPNRILADVLHGGIVPDLADFRAVRHELSRRLDTRSRRLT